MQEHNGGVCSSGGRLTASSRLMSSRCGWTVGRGFNIQSCGSIVHSHSLIPAAWLPPQPARQCCHAAAESMSAVCLSLPQSHCDDDLKRFAAADRRKVDPPIPVDMATWSNAGRLDWWVKRTPAVVGQVRGANGRQLWIKASDLRPVSDSVPDFSRLVMPPQHVLVVRQDGCGEGIDTRVGGRHG